MGNPNRSEAEKESIRKAGGNVHRKNPASADEQIRMQKKTDKAMRKLSW